MKEDLEVKNFFTSIIHGWYIVIVFGLIGALVGYGLSLQNPAFYEARAILSVGFNFDMSPPLTQYDEDYALGKMASVVLSDDVLGEVQETLKRDSGSETSKLSLEGFRKTLKLIRKGSRWELIVVGFDPSVLAEVANVWAKTSETALWDAYIHAINAKDLQSELSDTKGALVAIRLESTDDPENSRRVKMLEDRISDLEVLLLKELKLGRGLNTLLSFEWTQRAEIPVHPVTQGRSGQILAGNMIGMIIGVIGAIIYRSWRYDR